MDERVRRLLSREFLPLPQGTLKPQNTENQIVVFLRDPRVKAYVLKRAGGRCEACEHNAPFTNKYGENYLEVHHIKPLANGGSDRVSNAVALCPNCHRAAHHAGDAADRASLMYQKLRRLIRE